MMITIRVFERQTAMWWALAQGSSAKKKKNRETMEPLEVLGMAMEA